MEQMTLFDMIYTPYKINKPIRLIELFAGIGSQSKALENLKANFEHWKICEWAIPSILAYKEIHQDYLKNYKVDYAKDKTKEELIDYLYNLGISSNYNEPMTRDQVKRLSENKLKDIYNAIKSENNLVNISTTKGEDLQIKDTDKFDYIMSYSFPCQDLSIANGNPQGMNKNSGTRSGLLWQVERLLKECKELPQILLMENVPQVIGEQNIKDFQEWEYFLESLGYKNYVEVLNAKDYGIPQNRQRCFMVSILGDYVYNFPRKQKLELRLKDMLEENVDEKYNLNENILKCFTDNNNKFKRGDRFLSNIFRKNNDIAMAITTRSGERVTDNFVFENKTICLNSKVNGKQPSLQDRIYDTNGIMTAITTCFYPNILEELKDIDKCRIRKLTPKECYRLMGFDDLDCDRASKVISDRWIYHTAGDSIVVNVLMAIFGQLM